MKINKKGVNYFIFISLIVIAAIALILILSNTDFFKKTDVFVNSCRSIPFFEYKCANTLGDGKSTVCPTDGWNIDRSKECEKVGKVLVECCYRPE